ncbi:putative ABC transporter ATP-binding protein YxlF [Botrimarina colliarenosi]|uniref:Putative ABC transporter ATP-binding protein YxlF n=1 Tax=Botrimarina colliarenosi TaxID=2528001 RepID=A0A5C6A708_9BACT|nr:ABC transporter ATP-binding protein [Botrimarina colliarenosi]TWT94861.1 putative ABC transporter ATP-binding protein YxlF [Botrimarina colliarenosi]
MIRVDSVWHHYGIRPVLKDVSFTVETGELVVILGPNGTGKSTLLGCLGGILSPIRGSIAFHGVNRRESVEGEREIRKRVAYLPDDAWMPRDVTGREYLIAIGRLYGVDDFRAFEHVNRLLALFHLGTKQDALIGGYSTGQRKKLALAGTLIAETPYLLLDEPFSGGLDPAGIQAVKKVLKKLADDQGITVVITTPVPEIIEELADRVVVLRDGSVVAYETPAGIKQLAGESRLDDALTRLMYPETMDGIDQYMRDEHSEQGESR